MNSFFFALISGTEYGLIFGLAGMAVGLLFGLIGMYFSHRRRALWHETARLALDNGLSHQLRSIESIRTDALAEAR